MWLLVDKLILDMEEYAKKNKVPILKKDALEYIINFVRSNNIKNILEIGTAIAYSTINLALNSTYVVSIEKNENMYKIAKENLKKSKLDNVKLYNADALEFDNNMIKKFDLIFVDAAKSSYIKYFQKYEINLNEHGYFLFDNMDFRGLVHSDINSINVSKRIKRLVDKIKDANLYFVNKQGYNYNKINLGDGLVILGRK